MPIETFEQFIKRILTIVFWLIILAPMIIIPILFIIIESGLIEFPINPYALIAAPDLIMPIQLELMASSFFKVVVFPGFTTAALAATVMILFERKFLAKINLRVGPLYAGKFEGFLQPIADLFKLISKELIIPKKADKTFFIAVPFMLFAVVSALLAVIPIGPNTYVTRSPISLLIFFAIMGFFPIIVLLAAWSSSNKFSLIGGLRALHQMISYEIPLILVAVSVVILSGSLDLYQIVIAQQTVWFIIPMFLGACIFYVASLAELERIPFDMPEADTEIVAGWLTEYSGMFFGIIQLAIYVKFYALSALFTVLFLGGWYGPGILPPEAWFLMKTLIVMVFMILPRGFNPRIRIDMMVKIGWRYLIIISIINLLIAVVAASILSG